MKQKSGRYTREREATAQEAEDMEVKAGRKLERPLYVTNYEAIIRGIDALYPENDLRELLIVQILDELKAFKKVSIDELTNAQLTRWKKWATSVDLTLDKASESIAYGRVLLTKENLEPLSKLENLDKNGELERFNAFLEQLR